MQASEFSLKNKFERNREQLNNNLKDREGGEGISQGDSGIGCGTSMEILSPLETGGPAFPTNLPREEGDFPTDSAKVQEPQLLSSSPSGPAS